MLIYNENGPTAFGGAAKYKTGKKRKRISIRRKAVKRGGQLKKRHTKSKKVKKSKKRSRKKKKNKSLTVANKKFLKTLGLRVKNN